MQILSYINKMFKIVKDAKGNYIVHGPNVVPESHPLYRERYYSWGTYTRKLTLKNGMIVTFIIYRFYLPEQGKTYSLLPFFITPYQRHINTVIEECIMRHILQDEPMESLCKEPAPKYRTVRRWINKFKSFIDHMLEKFEMYLFIRFPSRRTARSPLNTLADKVNHMYEGAVKITDKSGRIHKYGLLSYINHAIAVQTAKL